MPQSYKEYPSGSVTLTAVTYAVPFKYLSIDDVNVIGFDGDKWIPLTLDASAPRDAVNKTVTLATAPNTLYTKIRLYRATSTTQLVDFQNGSRLSESDLDTAYQQGLFAAQEIAEDASTSQFAAVREAGLQSGTSLSNFASQSFTGDNSSFSFNITAFNPQTTVAEAYRVSIDGVMQSPTDAYSITLSPAQITFLGNDAPPTRSKIVVVTAASAASAVSVDDVTIGLTSANKAEIKDLSVSNAKLAGGITQDKLAGSIATSKLAEVIDDDTMTTGVSATSLASSESIKAYVDSKTSDPTRDYESLTNSTVSNNVQQNATGRPLWTSFTLYASGRDINYLVLEVSPNSDMSGSTRIGQSRMLGSGNYDSGTQVTGIVPSNYYWKYKYSLSSGTPSEMVHSSFVL